MKKIFFSILTISLLSLLTSGCDKTDVKSKKLHHGDGTWDIVSIHYEYYDSLGHTVISDSTVNDAGQIIFFSTKTLDALWGYYMTVIDINGAGGNVAVYPCGVFFDEVRANIETNPGGTLPPGFAGLWTVDNSSRRKQEWSQTSLRSDGSLYSKVTMVLKF